MLDEALSLALAIDQTAERLAKQQGKQHGLRVGLGEIIAHGKFPEVDLANARCSSPASKQARLKMNPLSASAPQLPSHRVLAANRTTWRQARAWFIAAPCSYASRTSHTCARDRHRAWPLLIFSANCVAACDAPLARPQVQDHRVPPLRAEWPLPLRRRPLRLLPRYSSALFWHRSSLCTEAIVFDDDASGRRLFFSRRLPDLAGAVDVRRDPMRYRYAPVLCPTPWQLCQAECIQAHSQKEVRPS